MSLQNMKRHDRLSFDLNILVSKYIFLWTSTLNYNSILCTSWCSPGRVWGYFVSSSISTWRDQLPQVISRDWSPIVRKPVSLPSGGASPPKRFPLTGLPFPIFLSLCSSKWCTWRNQSPQVISRYWTSTFRKPVLTTCTWWGQPPQVISRGWSTIYNVTTSFIIGSLIMSSSIIVQFHWSSDKIIPSPSWSL